MNIKQFGIFIFSLSSETIMKANTEDSINNIIGIGGILATIIVGIISCIVTWKLTKLSIKKNEISYSIKTLNILSNSIKNQHSAFNDLQILYEKTILENPCLLLLEIENTGNKAISNPPISIRVDSNTEIIPGYFQDIEAGYEKKWTMQQKATNCCNISLEHINPKQVVKACFFLNDSPKNIAFECPMADVFIQKKSEYIDSQSPSSKKHFGRLEKSTFILLIMTVIFLVSMDFWIELFHTLNWYKILPAPAICIVLFVLGTLVISILLNVFGIKKLDNFVYRNKKASISIQCILSALSLIFILFILYDIVITNFYLQIIVAIIIVCMLSFLIHIISIDKNKD